MLKCSYLVLIIGDKFKMIIDTNTRVKYLAPDLSRRDRRIPDDVPYTGMFPLLLPNGKPDTITEEQLSHLLSKANKWNYNSSYWSGGTVFLYEQEF